MQSSSSNNSLEKSPERDSCGEEKAGSGKRILFIDDDEAIVDGYKFIFECEGFIVDVAMDAKHALELVGENSYSAIVLDYILPEIKGVDLAEQIQAIDDSNCLILISGQKDIEAEVKDKGLRVDGVFLKPLKIETLIDFIWEKTLK